MARSVLTWLAGLLFAGLALGCAAALVGVWPGLVAGSLPAVSADRAWALSACLPEDLPDSQLDSPVVAACLADAYEAAVRDMGLVEADAVLARAEEANPRLSSVCHDVSHEVGRRVYALVGGFLPAVRGLRARSCANGTMHGLADELAVSSPTEEDLRGMVHACESSPTPLSDCADSLGHVFWTSAPELPGAAMRCDAFSEYVGRNACVAGVVMRMALPQQDAGTPVFSAADVASACRDWASLGRAFRHGCSLGLAFAAYVESSPQFQTSRESVIERGLAGDVEGLFTQMEGDRSRCAELPYELDVARCVAALGRNLVLDTKTAGILPLWCATGPGYAEEFCLADAPDAFAEDFPELDPGPADPSA